jgi:hypothetical protein
MPCEVSIRSLILGAESFYTKRHHEFVKVMIFFVWLSTAPRTM